MLDLKKSLFTKERIESAKVSLRVVKSITIDNPRSLVKLIPFNNRIQQGTLREFNLKKHEFEQTGHKVDHVRTNKILSANGARTLRTRFERKPQNSENIIRK
jgi:hypothetical protein